MGVSKAIKNAIKQAMDESVTDYPKLLPNASTHVFFDAPNLYFAETFDKFFMKIFKNFIDCFRRTFDQKSLSKERYNKPRDQNVSHFYEKSIEEVFLYKVAPQRLNLNSITGNTLEHLSPELKPENQNSGPKNHFSTVFQNKKRIEDLKYFFESSFKGTVYVANDGPSSLSKV